MSNTDSLYKEFLVLVEEGDEAKVRAFVVAHFKEFPEEVQDKLTLAFFEEALTSKTDGDAEVSNVMDYSLNLLREMGKAKSELEDEKKVIEVKQSLDM